MRLTPNDIKQRDKKIAAPLVCLTAYTYRVAQLLDESCDLFLVGDSVAMVLYGMDSTVGVSLDTMICHGVLIEGTVEPVARRLTEALSVPTIGIGASAACDGQILVTEDMLGLMPRVPKFVREYGTMSDDIAKAGAAYAADVRARKFPSEEHYYHAPKDAATKTKVS